LKSWCSRLTAKRSGCMG